MNQLKPLPLWVGHAGDGRNFKLLLDCGITALVQVAVEEAPLQPPRELIYCRYPLVDGIGNNPDTLVLVIQTVTRLIQMEMPTLISCGAGLSRSPAITAAGLAMAHQEPAEKWLLFVKQYHPCDVSPGLWKEIKELLP